MKKNGQYVGVDEKYVPEDEKYVDNNLNSEIKNDMHNIYQGIKGSVSDKDNQEKMKNTGRKIVKIAKGVGISYLAIWGIMIVGFIIIFVSAFVMIARTGKFIDKQADDIINQGTNTIDNSDSKINVNEFNFELETYNGTQYGLNVSRLLDNVITKIKKNTNHSITVTYGTTTTSNTNEITTLKKQIDETSQYEVSLDYDSNGYINKVTITND